MAVKTALTRRPLVVIHAAELISRYDESFAFVRRDLTMVFHYCERVSMDFWAEPVNALSNVAFLLAAGLLSARLIRARVALHTLIDIVLLIVLLCCIAVGSFLWHTLAAAWSEWADIVPILLFISLYLLSFLVRIARLRPLPVLAVFLLYHGVNIGLQWLIPPQTLNGSMFYLPTLASLIMLGVYCQHIRHPMARHVLLAGGVFAVSIGLRTLDFSLCPHWPLGTHFLWHLLTAYVLYTLTRVLLVATPASPPAHKRA